MADIDLQRMGGGGGGGGWGSHPDHPDPEIREGGGLKFFSALRTSVWSKNNRGERDPPGLLPWIRH